MAMTASRQQVRIGRRVEMRRAEIVNLGQVA
jgi:hypothetical protein